MHVIYLHPLAAEFSIYDSTSPKVNVISAKNINNSKPSLLLLNLSQLMRSNISVQLPLCKHVIAKL